MRPRDHQQRELRAEGEAVNIDEAEDVLIQLTEYFGRKPLGPVASKHWCRGLMKYHKAAAVRALGDVFDSSSSMPPRGPFLDAVRSRHFDMFPRRDTDHDIEPWEAALGAAVIGHFTRYLRGDESLQDWCNNFRAIAKAQGVEAQIDWSKWEDIGARFYV